MAVYQAIAANASPTLWVGSQDGLEAGLVQRAGIPFVTIPAAGVHGVGLRRLPRNLWQLWKGLWAARKIIRSFKPDVLFFTGGYLAIPVALAGIKIPSLLYVPDIEPGLALKVLARFADKIALTTASSRSFFKPTAPTVVTGYPTRPGLENWNRATAQAALGLNPNRATLLIFGGSRGAHAINQALLAILPEVLTLAQVVHISGEADWEEVQSARSLLPKAVRSDYHAYPYLHEEMGAALAAADLVVSRAGASSLGEFPLFSLPAILVPYPYAWRYQRVNADFLANQGAAIVIENAVLPTKLLGNLKQILLDDEARAKMAAASKSLAQPNAAGAIGKLLLSLADQGRPKVGGRPWSV